MPRHAPLSFTSGLKMAVRVSPAQFRFRVGTFLETSRELKSSSESKIRNKITLVLQTFTHLSLTFLSQWPPQLPSLPPPLPTPAPDSPSGSGARRSPLSTARPLHPLPQRSSSTATLTSMSRRILSESLTTVNSRRTFGVCF